MPMNWPDLLNPNRRRPTTSSGDDRAQFERDFDRSVFSTPVKRLQDKAQVFPLETHDAIRTRLTHSLEVSSVARGLATSASKWLIKQGEIGEGMDRSIEAIAATCGLIHDLGNPPFGHSGEDAIRSWFRQEKREKQLRETLDSEQQIQDFLDFEGNAQSLRLVATLQVLADRFGLNLTFGTLSALRKYVVPSDKADRKTPNRARRKPGYFASENEIVQEISDATGTGASRHPICFLVEAADDIVYLAADVEDAVKKGVLSWRAIYEQLASKGDSVKAALSRQENILKAGRPELPSFLDDDIHAAAFRTGAIAVMAEAVVNTFAKRYQEIMSGTHEGDLLDESEAAELAACLRTIGQTRVYPTRSTLTLELMGRHVIADLMDVFWEGAAAMPIVGEPKTAQFAGKAAALISSNYRHIFQEFAAEKKSLPEMYHRYQLVTDYICGMTDSFAKRLHSELFNGS
jgi:dGTPase